MVLPMTTPLGRLEYLYVGSGDVEKDLAFYRDVMGARVVWDFREFGTRVASVELGERPPLYILAGHRPAKSVLPIFLVERLDEAERFLRERGWRDDGHRVEVPDGPVRIVTDPSGNQVGLLEPVRGRPLEEGG